MKTFKELKDMSMAAAAALKIEYDDAARLVAVYSAAGDWSTVEKIEGGDLGPLISAAASVGVVLPGIPATDNGSNKATAAKQDKNKTNTAAKKDKPAAGPGITSGAGSDDVKGTPAGGVLGSLSVDIPAAGGDLVPSDFDGVPAVLLDLVTDCIKAACDTYNIDDLSKAPAERWRAVCMYTGRHIKQSRLLWDIEKLKRQGGSVIYNPVRVAGLLEVWVELCAAFDKAPMACDFISFCGISASWFYDANGRGGLTSAQVDIAQKLQSLQESGLAVRLADGRRNPTGQIFILKNFHGWRDQREIIHNDNGGSATAPALPVFNMPALPNNDV